jgi:predicted phage gp36 major capsid-like protein
MRCALAVFLACWLSASLSAQAGPSSPLAPSPGGQNSGLLEIGTTLAADSQTLALRLEERKLEAQRQVAYWENIEAQLKLEIENEKTRSADLLGQLEKVQSELTKLRADLKEISTSLDASKTALGALQTDFDNYKKARNVEIWLWRGAAAVGLAAAAAGVVYGLSR